MKNFIQDGNNIPLTPARDVLSGEGELVGSLFGVAVNDVASGESGVFKTTGVFELPKTTGASTAYTQGAKVYWKSDTFKCSASASGNTEIGVAIAPADDAATTVLVRLNGSTA